MALRAAISPMMLAMEPPPTNAALAPSGNSMILRIHRVTCRSRAVAALLPPPRLDPSIAARNSAIAPVRLPEPMYQAQKRGWMLPIE